MDTEYNAMKMAGDAVPRFRQSLFVYATVISANIAGRVTVDTGFKALSTDEPPPAVVTAPSVAAEFRFMGDEHGCVFYKDGAVPPPLGGQVILEAPHCDPTVNLYNSYCCVRGDALVEIWAVDARGCSW